MLEMNPPGFLTKRRNLKAEVSAITPTVADKKQTKYVSTSEYKATKH
jgi:hypothetical protein